MKAEEIAQWAIDNRYAKNEQSKISDAEMYQTLVDMITTPPQQSTMSAEEIIDRIIYSQTDGEEYACIKKSDCISAMEEYRNQPVKQPTFNQEHGIKYLDNVYAYLMKQEGTEEVNNLRVELFKAKLLLSQPVTFNPQRPPKEEAERVVELFADIDFEDSVLRSIQVVSYNIDSLKLRGLSTQYEEEVLTILKGM